MGGMLALALALGASVAWGSADFIAGVGCRHVALLTVLLVSQAVGLVLLVPVLAAASEALPAASSLALGALAGLFNVLALAALYRGLARGKMGLVAPIAATDAAIPVAFGLLTGDRPAAIAIVGIGLALAGVVLASRSAPEGNGDATVSHHSPATSVALGLAAAVCFGAFMVALDGAGDASTLWAVAASRIATVVLLMGAALVLRPDHTSGRGEGLPLFAVGALDLGASALFAAATTRGLLSVVGVLSSFYPVVTIVLARVFLRERLGPLQRIGAAAAVIGAGLMGSAS